MIPLHIFDFDAVERIKVADSKEIQSIIPDLYECIGDPAFISELEQYFLEKGYTYKNIDIAVKYEKEYPDKQKAHMNIYYMI